MSQIWAISVLNVKSSLRYKLSFALTFVNPLINVLFPLFLMTFLFTGNIISPGTSIGVFKSENYISLILLGTSGSFAGGFFGIYDGKFQLEKTYKTLPALIIAPMNRFNLLLGLFLSHLVLILTPFTVIFVLNYIISPTRPTIAAILLILLVCFLYALTQAGIGIFVGALGISRNNWRTLFLFFFRFVIMFNCVTFPKEIFPEIIHPIIDLNPFYHFFELNRSLWVFSDIFYGVNLFHFLIVIICGILSPIIGIILFNKIYEKYGIEGM